MRGAIDAVLSIPSIIALLFGLAYGLFHRFTYLQAVPHENASLIALVVGDATSPHYFSAVAITLWLAVCVVRVRRNTSYPQLIRFGSYRVAHFRLLAQSLVSIVAVAALVYVGWLVTALGLPLSSPGSDGPGWVGLACQFCLIAVSFTAIAGILSAARIAVAKAGLDIAIAILLWVWTPLSAIGVIPPSSPLNPGYYFNVAVIVLDPHVALSAAVILVIALVAPALVVIAKDGTSLRDRIRGAPIVQLGIAAGVTVLAVGYVDRSQGVVAGVSGALLSSYIVVQYLTTVVVLVGFVYVFLTRLGALREGTLTAELIRHGSYTKWLARLWANEARRIAVGVVTVFAVAVVGVASMTPRMDVAASDLVWALGAATVVILQLLFYCGIVFAAVMWTGSQIWGVAAVGAIVAVGGIQGLPHPWVPIAAWTAVATGPPFASIAMLAASNALLHITIALGVRRGWMKI